MIRFLGEASFLAAALGRATAKPAPVVIARETLNQIMAFDLLSITTLSDMPLVASLGHFSPENPGNALINVASCQDGKSALAISFSEKNRSGAGNPVLFSLLADTTRPGTSEIKKIEMPVFTNGQVTGNECVDLADPDAVAVALTYALLCREQISAETPVTTEANYQRAAESPRSFSELGLVDAPADRRTGDQQPARTTTRGLNS